MKLAEALILRADHQKRIEQIKARLLRNARVQEGEQAAEDPNRLIEELERVCSDLVKIIQDINKTNAATELAQTGTLADVLALRDVLQLRHGIFRELAKAATVTQDRSTKSEVKFRSTVSVSQVQQRADDLAREHRDLDARIQETNWQTELREQ